MSALTVTRLLSRGVKAGRSHRSRKSRSVVYCTTPAATLPKSCSTRAAVCFGVFIEGQKLWRCRRKLVRPDATPLKNVLCYGNGRSGIRPAGIERKMRDDLRKLTCFDAIV